MPAVLRLHQRQRGRHQPRAGQDLQRATSGPPTAGPDLASDHDLDGNYDATSPGNVVQTGRVKVNGLTRHQRFIVSIGFAPSKPGAGTTAQAVAALATARASLATGFARARSAYDAGWASYLATLHHTPASASRWTTEWKVSVMVLAGSEDKTFRGGFVAAPARPWSWANSLQNLAVYHAVWSRDLYQIATGLLAVGDTAAAGRALDYLWTVQQRTDGSFPQNSRLDGTPVFGDLQLDEVAFPIVLAHQLGRTGSADWAHVKKSADFIVAKGPSTPQERWENIGGYSPATIAAEIAGLVCAADIATKNGDTASAASYLAKADEWRGKVESWTATTNGPYAPKPYYLRVTTNGDPDVGTQVQISDGGPLIDQRQVVDPSFLELVRLGVKRADNATITSSIKVIDDKLSYTTANGQFWHRASFDGYGEKRDGTQWEPVPTGSGITIGRGWPLLGGERGEFALVAGTRPAAQMAEQVWDLNAPAPGPGFTPGEPTFSATPLAWTHAQFLRLAASVDAGTPVETPRVVACRYHTETCAMTPAPLLPPTGNGLDRRPDRSLQEPRRGHFRVRRCLVPGGGSPPPPPPGTSGLVCVLSPPTTPGTRRQRSTARPWPRTGWACAATCRRRWKPESAR